jgi:glucose/arabinose dehydrogenase
MKMRLGMTMASAIVLAAFAVTPASAEMTVNVEVVAEGLQAPLLLVQPPGDDRRFIVEQRGRIRILADDNFLLDEPFLDISHKVPPLLAQFDERGLLSIAFHPDFQENGRFFVYYSGYIPGDATLDRHLWWSHTNYVAEYRVSPDNPDRADPRTERIILAIDWPQFNHNGGWMDFGPDGHLYISTGDGGYANDWGIGHDPAIGNGQSLETHLGKVLRIDVDAEDDYYAVPEDNPFAQDPNAEPEIWAYGLRNPWRCSFDMGGDNELFCADVGQNAYESVYIINNGDNLGWRVKEGSHCFDFMNPNDHPEQCEDAGMVEPILEYQNCNVFSDCRGISITGGYVYRGVHEEWDGIYFFADWSKRFDVPDGRLYAGRPNGDGTWALEDITVGNGDWSPFILGFGQDADGEVYVLTSETLGPVGNLDRIYRLVP